jgi:hypothetical protein
MAGRAPAHAKRRAGEDANDMRELRENGELTALFLAKKGGSRTHG